MRAYAFLGEAQRPSQAAVVDLLRAQGVDLDPLENGSLDDLEAIAGAGPSLLFLCGLPYARLRDGGFPVEPLVAPVAADAADGPPVYWSVLVGRHGLEGQTVDDLGGARLAINHRPSMSGWVLPVGEGLPLERFAAITETGGHRRSLDRLLAGDVDAAPIDSMVLAVEGVERPDLLALPRLAAYGPSPSPPVVLVAGDAALADRLRGLLSGLHRDPAGRAALALGCLARYESVDDAAYDATRACDRRAAACTR